MINAITLMARLLAWEGDFTKADEARAVALERADPGLFLKNLLCKFEGIGEDLGDEIDKEFICDEGHRLARGAHRFINYLLVDSLHAEEEASTYLNALKRMSPSNIFYDEFSSMYKTLQTRAAVNKERAMRLGKKYGVEVECLLPKAKQIMNT